MPSILIALAGLMGAGGIALAAASAHVASGLDWAASMLLFHAVTLLALALLLERGLVRRPLGLAAAFGFIVGPVLFSGNMALQTLMQAKLFPMATPTGGFIMIAAWLLLAVAAIVPRRSSHHSPKR